MAHVLIGHVEVALVAPRFSPGVADDEALLEVVVADSAHGMATPCAVAGLGHHHLARPGHITREAGQDSKAKDEGITMLDAGLHLVQILGHVSVGLHLALLGHIVAVLVRLLLEEVFRVIVVPQLLRANTQLLHDLDAVAEHGPRVAVHGVLHVALVVVDEEPGRCEVLEVCVILHSLLVKSEVEGSRQCVRSAAAQVPLIEDFEATVERPQIANLLLAFDLLLDLLGGFLAGKGHVEVAMVRNVTDPAHSLLGGQLQPIHARMSRQVHLNLILGSRLALATTHGWKNLKLVSWHEVKH
mmetsp:Transcript_44458/g.105841  ORF Transcript_44458/g.105841 Transcript_44458/m.105841 type:complete len:299 (+) Transcript_44458:279-1175(+)